MYKKARTPLARAKRPVRPRAHAGGAHLRHLREAVGPEVEPRESREPRARLGNLRPELTRGQPESAAGRAAQRGAKRRDTQREASGWCQGVNKG